MVNMRDKIKETKELLKNRFSHYFIFFNDNKILYFSTIINSKKN